MIRGSETTALALFSGGLDSILACRVIMAQGIKVQAVKFVSPFFDYHLLAGKDEYARMIMDKYGITVAVRDVSVPYLSMLRKPVHGYGKNFNPCVDCKILLVNEAVRLLAEFWAAFIISGEVIGQRPMSQRRDTLRVIERDSGGDDLLLRPLCAKLMKPIRAEREGLVDREQLLDFSGRNRNPQMELAQRFGITDYPAPAGGCSLTDPNRASRVAKFYEEHETVTTSDAQLLLFGRHFFLPGGAWFVLGRDEKENNKLEALACSGDIIVRTVEWPGPAGLLRFSAGPDDVELAVALVRQYSKKGEGQQTAEIEAIQV